MVYEGILTGFNPLAETNDEHRFIIKSLYTDENIEHKDLQYRRFGSSMLYRTRNKPTRDVVYKTIEVKASIGSTIMIEMVANVLNYDKKPIKETEGILEWFNRHGKRDGFSVCDCACNILCPLKVTSSQNHHFSLHRVQINAVITITDPEKFSRFYETGAAKSSYGLGMLVIR